MGGDDQQIDLSVQNDWSWPLPQTIAESIAEIKTFALRNFAQEITAKQLYYHNYDHIQNVQRRSHQILQAIRPTLAAQASIDFARTELLLDLCVVAHDMVQVFDTNSPQHTARRRNIGVSETATIDQLVQHIDQLNSRLDPSSPARLIEADIHVIRESIEATICVYDSVDQAIYQPSLYDGRSRSIVTCILALADLGALGIDGIEGYHEEGSLLFLEENLDVVPLLLDGTIYQLETLNSMLHENIRQRLLKRSRFQVNFAKSRLARFNYEIQEFPAAAIPPLTQEVFKYLTPDTVQTIEAITPTNDDVSLENLLHFFQLERYVRSQDVQPD